MHSCGKYIVMVAARRSGKKRSNPKNFMIVFAIVSVLQGYRQSRCSYKDLPALDGDAVGLHWFWTEFGAESVLISFHFAL